MECVGADDVALWLEHGFPRDDAAAIEVHLGECHTCRRLVSAVAQVGSSMVSAQGQSASVEDDEVELSLLRRGSRLGRYEIVGVLGVGAMGVVYEADDPVLERRVAVKLIGARLREQTGSEEARLRLMLEAKAMA